VYFLPGERVAAAKGVEPGAMEGLIGVDVPDPCEEALIQKKGLEGAPACGKARAKAGGGELRTEGLRAQAAQHSIGVIQQEHSPKLAGVAEAQLPPTVEVKGGSLEAIGRRIGGGQIEIAAHLQVNQQASAIERKDKILPAPGHVPDRLASNAPSEQGRRGRGNLAGPAKGDAFDAHAHEGRGPVPTLAQMASDRFNFRKLRHSADYTRDRMRCSEARQ